MAKTVKISVYPDTLSIEEKAKLVTKETDGYTQMPNFKTQWICSAAQIIQLLDTPKMAPSSSHKQDE